MLHTGTGNDQQASDDFLALYELYTPLPVEPGYQSCPITSPFRLTAHATIAIGLLITSRALLRDSVLLARVIFLTNSQRYLRRCSVLTRCRKRLRVRILYRAVGVHPSVHRL